MLSTPSKNGSPKNADSGSSNAAHSTIPPRLVLPAAAFQTAPQTHCACSGQQAEKTGQASAAHTCTVQTANRICFRYEERARKLGFRVQGEAALQSLRQKRAGQSAAPKMHRRRAGRYTRRISDLLHNPHGTDVQRYRSNLRVSHRNCGKRPVSGIPVNRPRKKPERISKESASRRAVLSMLCRGRRRESSKAISSRSG